ncbi:MAG: helix-turn-helix protein [Chlamydiota bacterium]|jgi:transcriptional regulator with XRE-family HTH domain
MDFSELLLVEEIAKEGTKAFQAARGLSPGALIKMIRKQIGMPQEVLARRAKVPQSTISRIEKGQGYPSLATLRNILQALDCDLVVLPILRESVSTIRRRQARKRAEIKVGYLLGTMHLEEQEPDQRFTDALLQQEEEKLLRGPNSTLWKED